MGLPSLLSTVVVIVMAAVYGAPAIGAVACIPVSLGYHSAGNRAEGTAMSLPSKGLAPCPSASSEVIKKPVVNRVFIMMCRLLLP
jgi:hypothetical protein